MADEAKSSSPEPQAQTPTPQKEEPKPVQESKPPADKGLKTLYIIVIVLGIIALGLVSFIVYSEVILKEEPASNTEQDDTEEQDTDEMADAEENEEEDEEEEPVHEEYEGDYVTATLSEGWSIVEYEDGAGSDMLTDNTTFTGLTALEVVTPGEGVAFKIYAVHGIGGVEACENYFQFEDDSEDYYNEIVADSAVHSIVPTIVDYSATDYTEFTFLGLRVRRVEDKLFWDTVEDATYFQAACGLSYSAWNLEGVSFTADGIESSSYMWEINDQADEAILLELDDILDSIEGV